MPSSIDDLIAAFGDRHGNPRAYDSLPELLARPSSEVEKFIQGVLAKLPKGGTYLDAAISHVSDEAVDDLVRRCVGALTQGGRSDAIEAVMAYASLQRPASLHPFLPEVFDLRPNARSQYENWPWRESGAAARAHLEAVLAGPARDARKALNCLLETRHPEAFELVRRTFDRQPPEHPIATYFEHVGFTVDGGPLCPSECMHLVFPEGHFPPSTYSWSVRALHPSWHLRAGEERFRFGGHGSSSCALCDGALHHLLTLPASRVFPADATGVVALQVCLSCLGWEVPTLYYHHESGDSLVTLNQGRTTPQFPVGPLTECAVGLAATPSRWRNQDWGLSNSRENLHRVGGYPCWVQGAAYPECPSCARKMRFIAQLDSGLPTADGGEWLWGSGGIGYAFGCTPCRNTAFLWQCT